MRLESAQIRQEISQWLVLVQLAPYVNVKWRSSASSTGFACAVMGSLKRVQDADTPLEPVEHAKYRTVAGKLLWPAFVLPDCSYAVKELSCDVKSPTLASLAQLKHLVRYIVGRSRRC